MHQPGGNLGTKNLISDKTTGSSLYTKRVIIKQLHTANTGNKNWDNWIPHGAKLNENTIFIVYGKESIFALGSFFARSNIGFPPTGLWRCNQQQDIHKTIQTHKNKVIQLARDADWQCCEYMKCSHVLIIKLWSWNCLIFKTCLDHQVSAKKKTGRPKFLQTRPINGK